MSRSHWAIYLLAVVICTAAVGLHYWRRETAVRGRHVLVALRAGAGALILLLLFDPRMPAPHLSPGGADRQVLIDGSLSMGLPVAPGTRRTRWEAAVADARRSDAGGRVLVFGARPLAVRADSLRDLMPQEGASRLLPALQAAAEAGVHRVTVLTDGELDDAEEVARWLPRLGIDADYRTVGEPLPDRALDELSVPPWAESGKPIQIRFGISAVGAVRDSVRLAVRQGDHLLATSTVPAPGPGRLASGTVRVTPEASPGGGFVRLDVAIQGTDAASADDERSRYIYVSEEPAGVALISFRPDWEPRFLEPVLRQSLGLPVHGFLRTHAGRYVRIGGGEEAGHPATDAEVRRVVAAADLVVLHGMDGSAPAWALNTLKDAHRLLVFPGQSIGNLPFPISLRSPVADDWYASPAVPPSPVAALLAGVDVQDVPPLLTVRPASAPAGAWAPLRVTRGRNGAPAPLLLAGETEGRRWAVALGEGYWRWAFRGDAARQTYARLWGAVAGWLVGEQASVGLAAVRPVDRVIPRGATPRWLAAGLHADSLAVRLTAGDRIAGDTVSALRGDTLRTGALAPGHYAYHLRAFAGGKVVGAGDGEITVESYTPEFSRPVAGIQQIRAAGTPLQAEPALPSRPLHSTWLPYALLVLLLSLEWILRRGWGLR